MTVLTLLLLASAGSSEPPALRKRELNRVQCWGLDINRRIKLMPETQRTPVCLDVDVLPQTNAVSLQIYESPPLGGRVCVQVQSVEELTML